MSRQPKVDGTHHAMSVDEGVSQAADPVFRTGNPQITFFELWRRTVCRAAVALCMQSVQGKLSAYDLEICAAKPSCTWYVPHMPLASHTRQRGVQRVGRR